MNLLVEGVGELATPVGTSACSGQAMGKLRILHDVYVLIRDGVVAAIGKKHPHFHGQTLDAEGRVVTPGLVDPHTHAVFAGSRLQEFLARGRGERYTGGGILTTVAAVRAASEEELIREARPRLMRMLRMGTTTVEIKSGYGLTTEDELKMLGAIRRLSEQLPLTIVPTFMGAHAFPENELREQYIARVIGRMIPKVAEKNMARFCDVFCDQGFYTVEEARHILLAAKNAGLGLKIHADELEPMGGSLLAAELHSTSADHLLHVTEEGIAALAKAKVVGVLLPGTAFVLEKPHPPARGMINSGMAIALGTDFNPGSCPIASMPIVMSLSVLKLGLSPEEALTAATLNAAAALELADVLGSIEPGKQGDLVVWEAETFAEIPYWIGHDLVYAVVQKGKLVWKASESWLAQS